ncbi:MAG: galactokinase [bacterium]
MDTAEFRRRVTPILGEKFRVFRAPGRVNIIGEHTDYNDGFVLPAAIDREILMAVRPTGSRQVILHSLDYNDAVSTFSLDEIGIDSENTWSNYLRGVCYVLEDAGYHLRGLEVVFAGDIPLGAGLSSSAALEVATAIAFLELSEYDLTSPELALLCQRAENDFVGNKCGIMDQFISALGQQDSALLIDCRSLEYKSYPVPAGTKIVIANTCIRHELVGSPYNERRKTCETAAKKLGVPALRDVSSKILNAKKALLTPLEYQRAMHVVGENERVLAAIKAMDAGDLEGLGVLLNESHDSLRDDYEVSCTELDTMVDIARNLPGVYGARMTGGGFGGSTVNLVAEDSAEAVVAALATAYEQATGIKADIYVCRASAGAGEVRE